MGYSLPQPIRPTKNKAVDTRMRFADLFCGGGFFSLGFQRAGFKHVFGLDNWKLACATYELNIGKAFCMKIEDFDGKEWAGKVDVVIGSPPCKTWSKANTKTRSCDLTLTKEFFRVVGEIKPKIWVMENVPDVYPFIHAPFKKIFSMESYGLLQQRKRCFASNVPLNLKKEKHKYLTPEKAKKLQQFRKKVIHTQFQTITCRYNSFTKISPHIQDKQGIRVITHTEAMQLQTIPFDFKFPKANQREIENLIGNAVPPLFAYKVALSIKTRRQING